jgi:hypothetical protein
MPSITLFSDSADSRLQTWLRELCAGLPVEQLNIRAIALNRSGLSGREYAQDVANSDAAIIDVDASDILMYAAEFGSFRSALPHLGVAREVSALDERVLLVTRKALADSEVMKWFGRHYATVSLVHGLNKDTRDQILDWLRGTLARTSIRVYLSYRFSQSSVARDIATSLRSRGVQVWFDEWSIAPGDSVPSMINHGLGACTHLCVLVDSESFQSNWLRAEYDSVLYSRLSGRSTPVQAERPEIIPLYLAEPTLLPYIPTLESVRGVAFYGKPFMTSMAELWAAVHKPSASERLEPWFVPKLHVERAQADLRKRRAAEAERRRQVQNRDERRLRLSCSIREKSASVLAAHPNTKDGKLVDGICPLCGKEGLLRICFTDLTLCYPCYFDW